MMKNGSSSTAEYQSLDSACGVVELTGWSSISIRGTDRQSFLNSFCSNDVSRLVPGASCEAFILNVKGKILAHVIVSCRDDELVLIAVPEQATRLIEHLDRYVIREDVQLRDTTSERSYLLLGGDEGRCGEAAQSLSEPVIVEWYQVSNWFARLLEIAPGEVETTREQLLANGGISCGAEAFEARRIEAGVPLYGIDFSDANLPQEIGRDRETISFTKGCYLGQETVARIDALGRVNQQIAGVRFDGAAVPEVGTEFLGDGRKVGRITSVAYSPKIEAPLALAMIRREASALGTRLETPSGAGEVVALPL